MQKSTASLLLAAILLLPTASSAAILKYHVEYAPDVAFPSPNPDKTRLSLRFILNAPRGSTLDVTNFFTDRSVPTPIQQVLFGPHVSGNIVTGVHMDGGVFNPDGTYIQPQYDVLVTTNHRIAFDLTLAGNGFGGPDDADGLFELMLLDADETHLLFDNGLPYGEAGAIYNNGGSLEIDLHPSITFTAIPTPEPVTAIAAAAGAMLMTRRRPA